MPKSKSLLPRREFLGGVAAGAAAIGLGDFIASAKAAESGAGTAFQSWLKSIRGKYRQVFDAPKPNNGAALIWSYLFLTTGAQGYDVPESELGAVVVIRHAAIPIALGDRAWKQYKLGKFFKINDPATNAPAVRNPFAHVNPGDMPLPEAALEKLVARGVKFAVCNAAILSESARVAQIMGLQPEAVRRDWLAAVLPGVQVVPSGVLAVNGAQTKRCSYCFAG